MCWPIEMSKQFNRILRFMRHSTNNLIGLDIFNGMCSYGCYVPTAFDTIIVRFKLPPLCVRAFSLSKGIFTLLANSIDWIHSALFVDRTKERAKRKKLRLKWTETNKLRQTWACQINTNSLFFSNMRISILNGFGANASMPYIVESRC